MSDGFFVAELAEDVAVGHTVTLRGPEAHHAAVVRRLVPGETVTLADGRGSGVTGTVAAVTKTVVTVAVEAVVRLPAPRLWITVAQALPKPDRAELALDLMTEVGVDEIVPWAAARSQVRWTGERGEKAQAKWQSVLREASKQSRRLRFPVLGSCASLAELVTRAGTVDCAIIMHERATTPIAACPVPAAGSVLIVIGPEGGLTDDEVTALTAAGGRAYLMGDTVLRTSTAGAVAVTQVRLLTGRGGTLG